MLFELDEVGGEDDGLLWGDEAHEKHDEIHDILDALFGVLADHHHVDFV